MKTIKVMMISLAALASFPAFAATSECIYTKNPQHAYELNVLAALKEAGIKGATMGDIWQTGSDVHDPEFQVTVNGKNYHVTCDDSGDGQCDCEVAQ